MNGIGKLGFGLTMAYAVIAGNWGDDIKEAWRDFRKPTPAAVARQVPGIEEAKKIGTWGTNDVYAIIPEQGERIYLSFKEHPAQRDLIPLHGYVPLSGVRDLVGNLRDVLNWRNSNPASSYSGNSASATAVEVLNTLNGLRPHQREDREGLERALQVIDGNDDGRLQNSELENFDESWRSYLDEQSAPAPSAPPATRPRPPTVPEPMPLPPFPDIPDNYASNDAYRG